MNDGFTWRADVAWPIGFDLFHPKRWAIYFYGRQNFRVVDGVFWFKKEAQAADFVTEWTPEKIARKSGETVERGRSDIFRGRP